MHYKVAATVACATALIGTPSFAAEYILHVNATGPQVSRYADGRHLVEETGPTSSARVVEALQQQPKQAAFRVFIFNNSDKSFDFGPENISIKMHDGTVVAMLTYADLMKKQKTREGWEAFAVGLAAAGRSMQASQAGNVYGTTSYSNNSVGSLGSTTYNSTTHGTATFSAYDPGAAAAAQSVANAETRNDIDAYAAKAAAQRNSIDEVMKTNTVDPGQAFGGIVQYLVPSSVKASKSPIPITVEVQAGNDIHIFQGTIEKY